MAAQRTSTFRAGDRRTAGARRSKAAARRAAQQSDADAWFHSSEGETTHRKALADVREGRVGSLGDELELPTLGIGVLCTDEFLRRHARLSRRRRRAFAEVLTALLEDVAASGRNEQVRHRAAHDVHAPEPRSAPGVLSFTWATGAIPGRATFLIEHAADGPLLTLLSAGPASGTHKR